MEKFYKVSEIITQGLLGIKKRAIHRLIKEGKLKAVNISQGTGRPNYRIAESAIKDFLEDSTITQ